MKNILTLLAICITSLISAQQLADGTHKYIDENLMLKMTVQVSDDGDYIDEIVLDTQGSSKLTGAGQWRHAPVNSDFKGEGWYEVIIDDMNLYLELDVLSSKEIEVTKIINGVGIVMVVSK